MQTLTKGAAEAVPTAASSTTASTSAVAAPTFSIDVIKSALTNVSHDVAAFVNPTLIAPGPHAEPSISAISTEADATASKGGDPSLGAWNANTTTTATATNPTAPRQRLRREVIYEQLLPFAKRGLTASKAAEELGIPYTTVLAIYNDPEFRREVLAPYRAVFGPIDNAYLDNKIALIRRIELGAERAFDKLMEILDDPDAPRSVQAAVARDLLDRRADTRAGRNDSTTVTTVSIDAAALLAAASAARAMDAAASPKVTPIRKVS